MPNEYYGDGPLKVFGMFSGGASSIIGLVEGPNHGKTYQVVGALTDDSDASGVQKLTRLEVPVVVHDYDDFCERKSSNPKKKATKEYYDKLMTAMMEFGGHTVALSGWMRIVPKTFLEEYPDTKNVHPAYLHFLTAKGSKETLDPSYDFLIDVGGKDPRDVKGMMTGGDLERAFKGRRARIRQAGSGICLRHRVRCPFL